MPWTASDAETITRPCCGATMPAERLWPGSGRFPHLPTCTQRYPR